MITLSPEDRPILLEALEDLMYKVSMELEPLKGGPMTPARKELTEKQSHIEALQHLVSSEG